MLKQDVMKKYYSIINTEISLVFSIIGFVAAILLFAALAIAAYGGNYTKRILLIQKILPVQVDRNHVFPSPNLSETRIWRHPEGSRVIITKNAQTGDA